MHTDIFPKAALEKHSTALAIRKCKQKQCKIPTRLTRKTAQQLLKKLNTDFSFHSTTVPPGIYPREIKVYVHTKPCTKTHTEVLLITAQTESNPNVHCMINKIYRYPHIRNYHLTKLLKEQNLIHATMWVKHQELLQEQYWRK